MDGKYKIFPRNLTARAAHRVTGNPASSRPESALDTSYPGYELNSRALESRFFPGLVFEYQRTDGAILSALELTHAQQASGLTHEDCFEGKRVYLWAAFGSVKPGGSPRIFGFANMSGLLVWRRIRDLAPGRVSILMGPLPGRDAAFNPLTIFKQFNDAHQATTDVNQFTVTRDQNGKLQFAIFSADRSAYLDRHGVILPETCEPGELTQATCAPWIYDFRFCTCFYWSANKPDMVASEQERYLDFFRDRENHGDPQDSSVYEYRKKLQLTPDQLAEGAWEHLPVILNNREPTPLPKPSDLYNRRELMAEIRYLATVEHALVAEYLFAYYSIDAPWDGTSDLEPGSSVADRFAIARDIKRIAIDEMRHLLWANRLLAILGGDPSTGRAEVIGARPTTGDGRKLVTGMRYLNHPFQLLPLRLGQLNWFLRVERVSQKSQDGLYVHALKSVEERPDIFPEHSRLKPIFKLLIDEGRGHYDRLVSIKQTLSRQTKWLRPLNPPTSVKQKLLHRLARELYRLVLDGVVMDFSLGEAAGAEMLETMKGLMARLDGLLRVLASDNVGFQFELPSGTRDRKMKHDDMNALLAKARENFADIASGDGPAGVVEPIVAQLASDLEEHLGEALAVVARAASTCGRSA
jgi:hypothetical protein